jgi:hypothetical protein
MKMEKTRKNCKTHCANLQAKKKERKTNEAKKLQVSQDKNYFTKTTNSKHKLKKNSRKRAK